MADVELVIKIPEKVYNALTHIEFDANLVTDEMRKSISNGTLLPKGHGRLIDADVYRKELRIEIPNLDYEGSLEPYEEGIYSAIMSLDDTPTIIKADKERSDADSN